MSVLSCDSGGGELVKLVGVPEDVNGVARQVPAFDQNGACSQLRNRARGVSHFCNGIDRETGERRRLMEVWGNECRHRQ